MFSKSLVSLAVASFFIPTSSILANDMPEVSSKDDTEVIVVIGKTPRKVQDVVGAVSVINSDEIDKMLVHDMATLFRYQAGINVINSGSRFGDSSIAIRGIAGNRVTTEIDGIPVADQFSVGSYSNSGRNTIDPDLIKQVEILRGPASSTYGSDAIGGVVSFITKKPVDLLSQTDRDVYLDIKTGFNSVDNSKSASLNTAFAFDKSSVLLSGSLRKGHELDKKLTGNLAKDTQDNKTQSFLAKYYYEISDTQEVSFSYDYFKRSSESDTQSFLGLDRFASTTLLLGDDETQRTNISINYEFVTDLDWLAGGFVRLYDQKTETVQLTEEERTSRGKNYLYNRDFFYDQEVQGLRFNLYTTAESSNFSHLIGYGVEVSQNKTIESRNGLQTNIATGVSTSTILSETFPVRDFPISEVEELGIYFNDEISIANTAITLIPAIRYDKYKLTPKPDDIYLEDNPATTIVHINEDRVSPKLSVLYQLNDTSKVYMQYVKGFRAPPFEDANIGLDIPMMKMRAIPNPDLKSETSDGYEIGFNYQSEQHQFDLVAFYNDYKDFIQTKVNLGFDPSVGRIIFQSQNIDNTEIYGAELSYKGQYTNVFSNNGSVNTYASVFWSKGENKDTDQPINEIDPNTILLGAQWLNANENIAISINANIVEGKSDIDDPDGVLATTAGYATFDLVANYYVDEQLTVSAGVYNITDRQYWKWSSVNGFDATDPLLESLVSPGINGSVQLKYLW
ncbi:TonB-dependent hemoglobin/transferrin/lactoferrin family receptor [Thalassotalea piscium]|uniref:Hemoglobin/transferrin/lactoferrin receptor protein n=1 Tax=Thalassotalea piscium TaxID=1230533 RepID=A0A7X0TSJ4_9GAMM|nr:TonB-dependent hemoglobin/transferrin/lactoferrin family receptor [Thalassotalea piscium]MBB6542192.1 hemoglobin/transferrin/lactoferrin receptor protein [Thalassotalea piscium]